MYVTNNDLCPEDLIVGGVRLFSLPQVCIRLNEVIAKNDHNSNDIANVVSQDSALTLRLLKIVNSPFYGFTSKVETINRAITLVGTRDLHGLAFAASAIRIFDKVPNDLIDMTDFWRHSIYCSVIARIIAERCNVLHAERLLVAGLLHDIGRLVMIDKMPELIGAVLRRVRDSGEPLYVVEQEMVGFDHAQVGCALLKEWRLPASLIDAVRQHHSPGEDNDFSYESAILHIADVLADFADDNLPGPVYTTQINPDAWTILGMGEHDIESILDEARPHFISALTLFMPSSTSKSLKFER